MNRGLVLVTIFVTSLAVGSGCSTRGASNRADAGATPDTGSDQTTTDEGTLGDDADIGPANTVACRVALGNALNPCSTTEIEQLTRFQGTDFGTARRCYAGFFTYVNRQSDSVWECVYGFGGELIAWDRIEKTQLCDGRAGAVAADALSMGQLMDCLIVDGGEWTWLLGFDPGPPTVAVQLATGTMTSTTQIDLELSFTLGGGEVAGSDLTFRYWYTADARGAGSVPQTTACTGGFYCDFSSTSVVSIPPRAMADSYAEISFPGMGIISPKYTSGLGVSITRTDGASYDQSNDYSYNGSEQSVPTQRITAYVKGALIYGTEP